MSTSTSPAIDSENPTELAIGQAASTAVEGLLGNLRERLLSSLQQPLLEILRQSEERVNGLVESSVREHLEGIRGDAIAAVMQSVLQAIPVQSVPAQPDVSGLLAAVSLIQSSMVHAEILRALLDGCVPCSGRCAIFVLRGNSLVGWQGRGFAAEDAVRSASLSVSDPHLEAMMTIQEPVTLQVQDWNPPFLQQNPRAHDATALLVPLVVRDKVVGVLFCDSGTDSSVAGDAIRLLASFTTQWIEIVAGRRARTAAATSPAAVEAAPEAAGESAEIRSDVQEDEQGISVSGAPQPEAPAESQSSEAGSDAVGQGPQPVAEISRGTAVVTLELPQDLSPEEQELHRKARRFAKLLAEEIKLYNKTKVDEGRANRDIYQRLREDIDKSRTSYDKRYGNTSANAANYFQSEIIRVLADNDVSLMGSDFPA